MELSVRVVACTPVRRYRAPLDRPLWLAQAGAMLLFAALMVVVQRTPTVREAPEFDDPDIQAKLIRYFEPATPSPSMAPVRERGAPAPGVPAPASVAAAPEVVERAGPSGHVPEDMARRSGIFSVADFMAAIEASKKDARASIARYATYAGETAVWAAEAAKLPVARGLELVGTGRQGGGLGRDVVDVEIGRIARGDAAGRRTYGGGKRAAKERFVEREAPQPERRTNVAWTASVGRDLIRGVVNRHRPDVRQCFREGMQRDPGLRGELEVAFTIRSDGTVAYPSIARSTVADRAVDECVTAAVKRWKFPVFVASGGDVDVRFPFAVGAA